MTFIAIHHFGKDSYYIMFQKQFEAPQYNIVDKIAFPTFIGKLKERLLTDQEPYEVKVYD